MKRKNLGKLGENLAASHLQKNKYKILARNFQSRFGEIDIVALDRSVNPKNPTLTFIEVKTRWSRKFGSPERAITSWKIKRMTKASQEYKLKHPDLPDKMRLDAVVINLSEAGEVNRIKIIQNISQ